jgi:NADH:ubiquinone oxidoreductase subunit 3 (subunit A)
LFLVFDVELLFLYPWAAMYPWASASSDPASVLPPDLRGMVFWEVIVFLASVVVAYIYAWRRGVFRWR